MKRLLTASMIAAFAAYGSADSLYFVSDANHDLYSMDLTTMAVTTIGYLGIDGANSTFGDLTYDSNNQTMYYSGGRGDENLYTVNLTTGAATLVGADNTTDMFALGYDPVTDGLYGGTSTSVFGSVNKSTGAFTSINGADGVYNEGLTYNTSTGQMILEGLGDTYAVDVATGAVTSLGQLQDLSGSNVFLNDNGITYDASRGVYWDYDYSGNLREINSSLQVINTYLPGYGPVSSVAYVPGAAPEPATMALLGLGAAGLLRRARKPRG